MLRSAISAARKWPQRLSIAMPVNSFKEDADGLGVPPVLSEPFVTPDLLEGLKSDFGCASAVWGPNLRMF
jgi:hypothetical protein